MNPETSAPLVEYALGLLSAAESREIEAAAQASPALARELAAIVEELALGATASLVPLAPSPPARARLLDALAGPERFTAFLPRLAALFDLGVDVVRALLERIDDAAAWEASPLAGVRLIHFQAGPAVAATDVGFVSMAAGTQFPRHRHRGAEIGVVLEGTLHDSGRVYQPGDLVEWAADSVHEYAAGPARDLVLMVAHSGIDLL